MVCKLHLNTAGFSKKPEQGASLEKAVGDSEGQGEAECPGLRPLEHRLT